jgi:YidC/Oxa1 family membrane protein insertase
VTLETRHAPFFGWIKDLSAPDPTTIFNLFGLLSFTPPSFLLIGVWPILMALTMFLQTKLNPTPPDPLQAKIMTYLPVIFLFLFATFPAGLVIYWTWNNVLSIGQQWVIMKRTS